MELENTKENERFNILGKSDISDKVTKFSVIAHVKYMV
jgi:hypothetical protein